MRGFPVGNTFFARPYRCVGKIRLLAMNAEAIAICIVLHLGHDRGAVHRLSYA